MSTSPRPGRQAGRIGAHDLVSRWLSPARDFLDGRVAPTATVPRCRAHHVSILLSQLERPYQFVNLPWFHDSFPIERWHNGQPYLSPICGDHHGRRNPVLANDGNPTWYSGVRVRARGIATSRIVGLRLLQSGLNHGHCRPLIGSPLQPFARRNQVLRIFVLFNSTGAAVHNTYGQWRHGSVKPGQFGQRSVIHRGSEHRRRRGGTGRDTVFDAPLLLTLTVAVTELVGALA